MCLLPLVCVLCVGVGLTAFARAQLRPRYNTTLALGAALMWFVRLAYLKADSQYTSAIVVYGLLNSLQPLSVAFGAASLVQAMQETKVNFLLKCFRSTISLLMWFRPCARVALQNSPAGHVQCLPRIAATVHSTCGGDAVAEVFLMGWALMYFLEGLSGFGLPVAVSAPMLVAFGHSRLESVCCCLIMNALASLYVLTSSCQVLQTLM